MRAAGWGERAKFFENNGMAFCYDMLGFSPDLRKLVP
jgi:hypothetical protein